MKRHEDCFEIETKIRKLKVISEKGLVLARLMALKYELLCMLINSTSWHSDNVLYKASTNVH